MTKGTTPIYQEIKNLSAAKSAYGNIVYNKAPAFLRQAEFYLGEGKFQTAVRAFLKKHEFGNAGWEDLLDEFVEVGWRQPLDGRLTLDCVVSKENEDYYRKQLRRDLSSWIRQRGMPVIKTTVTSFRIWEPFDQPRSLNPGFFEGRKSQRDILGEDSQWTQKFKMAASFPNGSRKRVDVSNFFDEGWTTGRTVIFTFRDDAPENAVQPLFVFPNYGDYGYGIFLLDDKSRDYVIKNIQNENDPFLRSMMWGSLWDSVREAELDPREYVALAIKNVPTEQDETIVSSILGRVGTATNYYVSEKTRDAVAPKLEELLLERIKNASTLGQRITFYRAFLNIAASENARSVLKNMLGSAAVPAAGRLQDSQRDAGVTKIPLKTKDKFDIVTRLLILSDPDAPRLLAELEKTETSDDAKRYAYAAKAGIPTADNKAKYWNDFTNNKEISESWIEAAFSPWNSIRHSKLTLPYLQKALQELPNHKRNRKIFFVNGWLGAFIGGQRSEEALAIVNKFLADNANLDKDLRLKILENVDLIERAVRIRAKYGRN